MEETSFELHVQTHCGGGPVSICSLQSNISKPMSDCYYIPQIQTLLPVGRLPLFRDLICKLKLIKHDKKWGQLPGADFRQANCSPLFEE